MVAAAVRLRNRGGEVGGFVCASGFGRERGERKCEFQA